jgi:anti-anti-sigma factor
MLTRGLEWSLSLDQGKAVLKLKGDIDASAEKALDAAYEQACSQNPDAILLDMEGVDYINSAGIALVIGLLAQERKQNRRLFASGVSEHYAEIFRITRLADMMTIVH